MENDEVETPNDAEVSDLIMEGSSQKGSPGLDKMDGNRPVFYMGEDILMRPRTPTTLSGEFKIVEEDRKIIVGVCAMAKKSQSKPMKEILHRLDRFEHIETLVFDEQVILTEPVENWPIVDALISFFSTGFPLDKAIKYKDLRQVFLVNDLFSQYALQDRREVYKILVREGISHPNYTVMNRAEDTKDSDKTFIETEDSVEVDGVTFLKPFVEKPVNAEDHNVYIYFPVSAGGGSQRLFRKIGSRSSFYSSVNGVRKTGSYIYEEFVPTDGTDVKVYTVGLDYAHAEARKSPALDGKVERDTHGKEVRYPVLLSAKEKVIARKVCQAFKQNVCGFDLLRTGGRSYVCDVNGFSFVKNSVKYYDDCAKILGTMVMRAVAPQLHIPWVLGAAPEDIPVVPTTSGSMMELRCVIAVIRHGDRTPKQKMKMEVKHRKWFELFEKYNGYKNGHLKLKKPKQLQEVLDIARLLLKQDENIYDPEVPEKKVKLLQLKLVLEMYGHFSGINRKVQFKYQPHGRPKRSSSEDEEAPKEASLVLIVKWGGELTPAGRKQAEDLGKAFRTLYPGGQGQFEAPGLGFLRLHSTFRHDLKIYASDEGRVQMTAAAFTKGMLALEGELTPILVQMVKSAHTNGLLDSEGETSKYQHIVKERLMGLLNQDHDFTEEDYKTLAATNSISLTNAMDFIKNPKKMCVHVYDMIKELTARIRSMKRKAVKKGLELYHGESWELLTRRWAKLEKDFRLKDGRFEISKIPDIYDCIKYDLQHNLKTLEYSNAEELFTCSKALADIVIPQEYGITMEEKLHISQSFCTPLLRKTHSDLLQCMQSIEDEESTRLNSRYSKGVSSPERFVRTRLYFTSESHIHSLLNMLRFGGLCDINQEGQWKRAMDYVSATAELNYMTQIVIMMFEDPSKPPTSDERFHIELHFSPGAYTCCDTNVVYPRGTGWRTQSNRSQPKKLDTLGFKMSSSFPHSMRTDTFDKTGRKIEEISKATIQETAEELNESEIFEKHTDNDTTDGDKDTKLTSDKASNAEGPSKKGETWSPDPNIPEWDWGDDCGAQKKGFKTVADANTKTLPQDIKQASNVAKSDDSSPKSPTSISDPISIQASPVSTTRVKRMSDPGETEEKRSRSLEDKKASTREDRSVYVDRHYLTVQLPLASEKYRHSFTNLFYLNPDAYRGLVSTSVLIGSASAPELVAFYPKDAFEGFSMVPTLRPLETLHNALTMKTMDAFLTKAITTKFVTPLSSPAFGPTTLMLSPRPPVNGSRGSAPSSSSSSAGPSSPTTTSTPIDIVSKLNKYIQSKVEMQEKSQAQKPNSLSVEKCPEDDKKDVDCQKATITKNGNG